MLSFQSMTRSGLLGMRGRGGDSGGRSQCGVVLDGLISLDGSLPPSERMSLEPRYPFLSTLCISRTAPLCLWMCCERSVGYVHPLRVWVTVPRQSEAMEGEKRESNATNRRPKRNESETKAKRKRNESETKAKRKRKAGDESETNAEQA